MAGGQPSPNSLGPFCIAEVGALFISIHVVALELLAEALIS